MKLIDCSTPTFPNTFAMVDDEDFDFINQWKWYASKKWANMYAVRNVRLTSKKRTIALMHRDILSPRKGEILDHADRNGLNNQKSNLRLCSTQENTRNAKKSSGRTSRYKGVDYHKKKKNFRVRIKVSGKSIYLGSFLNEADAALKYNSAAEQYFGDFAAPNNILEP